jgi:hypothetical protein
MRQRQRTFARFAAATAGSIAITGWLAAPPDARGEIGILDNVPAATLLVPWFEVELDGGGQTTLLSINNASDDIVLAHVTLWTEWWVPVLGFDIYLTGYDVQTMNLYDVIVLGDLPNTGPSNVLSQIGDFSSGPHNTFGGTCSAAFGSAPNYGLLSGLSLQIIQQSLSGQPRSSDGLCTALPGNENVARGYLTVDVVRRCANEHPNAVNYFVDGGGGTATNQNVLWGDYFLANPPEDFAQGFTMVHIEADGFSLGVDDVSCDTVDRYPTTFYCTLRNPLTEPGEDNREGLPSAYLTRYLRGGGFTGGTDLLVWRDKLGTGVGTARNCATTPTPLGQNQIVVFDEQENPLVEGGGPVIDPLPQPDPFPWGTNRAAVGTDLTIDSNFGWLFLNLNASVAFRQAAVSAVYSASGRFSVGLEALAVNSGTLGADNRRGPRHPDPTLGEVPNPDAPTLFDGTVP